MAEHEPNIGTSNDWYTPPEILEAIGDAFDLDPCSPGQSHWVPARRVLTKDDDGLSQEWSGFVWMNPPFGGRNGHVPWPEKFLAHGNGIALVRSYTSAKWFHDWAVQVDAMLFPRGKTKFIRLDGSVGTSPETGIVLLAAGERAKRALRKCGSGLYVEPFANDQSVQEQLTNENLFAASEVDAVKILSICTSAGLWDKTWLEAGHKVTPGDVNELISRMKY